MQTEDAYRRFLPHYQNPAKAYFVTFCTRDRHVLSSEARTLALTKAVENHKRFYYLHTAVVMPDHVHLLLTPLDWPLAEIMKRVKGASACEINRLLSRDGSVWQREYFDRQLRSGEHLRKKGEYIAENPV